MYSGPKYRKWVTVMDNKQRDKQMTQENKNDIALEWQRTGHEYKFGVSGIFVPQYLKSIRSLSLSSTFSLVNLNISSIPHSIALYV